MRISASTFLSITRIDWPSARKLCRATPNLVADSRRKTFRRFVEDQKARIGHQGATDGEHLLLAAGQQIGHAAGALGKPRKQRADFVVGPRVTRAAAIGSGGDQIFPRRQIGEHLASFGNKPDAELGDAIGRQRANFLTAKSDRTCGRRREPHDRAHGRGLAHAVAAHKRDHFTVAERERETEEHPAQTVTGLDPGQFEQRRIGSVNHEPRLLRSPRDKPDVRQDRPGSPPDRRRR